MIKKKSTTFVNIDVNREKRRLLGKAAADEESIPEFRNRNQMLYEDAVPLIIPRLKVNNPDDSKRYITLSLY